MKELARIFEFAHNKFCRQDQKQVYTSLEPIVKELQSNALTAGDSAKEQYKSLLATQNYDQLPDVSLRIF